MSWLSNLAVTLAPDVLTLQAAGRSALPDQSLSGTATITESPPAVHSRATISRDPYARLQRTLVIRHTSDDRIVAMIEVLSAGNKSSRHAVRSFLDKTVAALDGGVHLLLVDVHPPGPRDPNGIHGAMLKEIGTEEYVLGRERPLTTVAYIGGDRRSRPTLTILPSARRSRRCRCSLRRRTTFEFHWKPRTWRLGKMSPRSIKRRVVETIMKRSRETQCQE